MSVTVQITAPASNPRRVLTLLPDGRRLLMSAAAARAYLPGTGFRASGSPTYEGGT